MLNSKRQTPRTNITSITSKIHLIKGSRYTILAHVEILVPEQQRARRSWCCCCWLLVLIVRAYSGLLLLSRDDDDEDVGSCDAPRPRATGDNGVAGRLRTARRLMVLSMFNAMKDWVFSFTMMNPFLQAPRSSFAFEKRVEGFASHHQRSQYAAVQNGYSGVVKDCNSNWRETRAAPVRAERSDRAEEGGRNV